jgi:anti-sigma regulatory factor (Ser/Thr protein kinase)
LLDTNTGSLTYASAGHNPVLLYKGSTRTTQRHDTRGIPLGLIPGDALRTSLEDSTLYIESGDVLVQYTDGFHEAVNPDGEEFGLERMAELIGSEAADGNESVRSGLQRAVDRWEGTLPAADDKTLLVVSRGRKTTSASRRYEEDRNGLVAALWERRHGSTHHFSMTAEPDELDGIGVWLRRCVFIRDLSQVELERIEQGLYEVAANIIEHGCAFDESEVVDVWWVPDDSDSTHSDEWPGRGHFLVRDHGLPPESGEWSIPSLNSHKVRREGRGLGLRIILQTFEGVETHPQTKVGNLTVLKYRTRQTQPA